MRYLLPIFAVLLTACATSPSEIRKDEQAHIDTLTLDGEARPLAQCARNHLLNDPPNGLNPPTPVITEHEGRMSLIGNARDGTVYLADLGSRGDGVTATVYASRGYIRFEENGEAVVSVLERCAGG